jgi:hypothetical protein
MDNTFEIEKRSDNSIQVRLYSQQGIIDLVFLHEHEFLIFIAGQHKQNAEKLLTCLKI